MSAIARFAKEWKLEEGIILKRTHCGGASVYGLPDPLEEAAEASKGLANINMNVLALSSSVSPHRRGRNGLAARPMPAIVANRIRLGTMGSWP